MPPDWQLCNGNKFPALVADCNAASAMQFRTSNACCIVHIAYFSYLYAISAAAMTHKCKGILTQCKQPMNACTSFIMICSMQPTDSSHSRLRCCSTCLMEDVDGMQSSVGASLSEADASEAMPGSAPLLSGVVPYAVAQDPVPLTSKA